MRNMNKVDEGNYNENMFVMPLRPTTRLTKFEVYGIVRMDIVVEIMSSTFHHLHAKL